jgi:hypothetical protein
MDTRTLNALEGSIEKWQKIVERRGEDHGTANCPLCLRFISDTCEGCPVKDATGQGGCQGSPYAEWDTFMRNVGVDHVFDSESLRLAQAELSFLISLHPFAQERSGESE